MKRLHALAGASVLALALAVVLAGCGGGQASRWADLRSVTITVQQPGIPPPGGQPTVTSFSAPGQMTQVATALNAHHIAPAGSPTTNPGCAGGFQITLRIVPAHSPAVVISAYRCADQTSGGVSGDLAGFLAAVGISV